MDKVSSLYIHFPLCRHLCNYCDFYKTAPSVIDRKAGISDFHNYLSQSFSKLNKLMTDSNAVWSDLDTLYIGGGTPSLWGKEGSNFLQAFLKSNEVRLSKNCEATLEVNPGTWTEEGIKSFLDMGFNRFSVGIQSTRDDFLEKLDRVHRKKEVIETLEKFKALGVNYSVDFMLGLPYSRELERNITRELEEILTYKPSHLSLYILTVKDNYTHFENLPDEEWIEREFLEVSELLRSKGFEHYEVSNFALDNKRSEHNSKYWRGESIAALGPSATGFLAESGHRFKWKTQNEEFDLEVLGRPEIKMENFYLKLRTSDGLDLSDFFEGNELKKVSELAKDWKSKELCELDENTVVLTPRGYLIMDSLIDEVFLHSKSL